MKKLSLALLFVSQAAMANWSGQLYRPVYANSSDGTHFWNYTGYDLSCHFWSDDDGWYAGDRYVSPDGVFELDTQAFRMPSCPAYSLVAEDEHGTNYCIGHEDYDVVSVNGVNLWFFMNAPAGTYSDNSGYLTVYYDCSPIYD